MSSAASKSASLVPAALQAATRFTPTLRRSTLAVSSPAIRPFWSLKCQAQQALGIKGVRFDAIQFNYIGRATTNVPAHMVWHTAPAQSIDDLRNREVVTAAVGAGGTHNDLPRAQNALLGTRWKIVSGYRSNQDTRIAMERGEVQ